MKIPSVLGAAGSKRRIFWNNTGWPFVRDYKIRQIVGGLVALTLVAWVGYRVLLAPDTDQVALAKPQNGNTEVVERFGGLNVELNAR